MPAADCSVGFAHGIDGLVSESGDKQCCFFFVDEAHATAGAGSSEIME